MLTSDSYYAANSAVTRPANGEYTVRHTSYIVTNLHQSFTVISEDLKLAITCPVPASDPGRGEG